MTDGNGRAPLWKHQQDAIDFCQNKNGSLLALAMGTGKSRVAIELATQWQAQNILILCPKSVVAAWPRQFAMFDGNYEVYAADKGSVAAKTKEAQRLHGLATARRRPFACVINYDAAWRPPFAQWVLGMQWDLVIGDELHRIKAPGGRASIFAMRLRDVASRRLGLTGTPMPHSPLDIYAQYRFLDPSIFGTSHLRFKARYSVAGGYQGHQIVGWQNTEELHDKVYSIAVHVGNEVLDLPPVQHIERLVTLGPTARKAYTSMYRQFVAEVHASDAYTEARDRGEEPEPPKSGVITASNAMVKALRLSQITSGVAAIDGEDTVSIIDTAKADALTDILEDLPSDEPVVVFTRFRADLDTVRACATRTGRTSAELSGRRNELAQWQNTKGSPTILAVQIQAGGVGIDLTRAHYCVYLSVGLSLGNYEQSLARTHRPGQTTTVTYYHLIADGTIDQHAYKSLQEKRDVIDDILQIVRTEGIM